MEKFGMNVNVTYKIGGGIVFHNVTEVHYNFPSEISKILGMQVAIESDIHGTGTCLFVKDIQEFDVVPATYKHSSF